MRDVGILEQETAVGMVRKFVKVPGPSVPGLSPIGYYRNAYYEQNGDRKTPNLYTLRYGKYAYSFAEIRSYSRSHPEHGFTVSTSYGGGSYTTFASVDEYDTSGSPSSAYDADAYNAALGQLLRRMKSSDWNSVVFAAEAGKSLAMIANAATRIFATVRALKRGRLGDAYAALGIEPHISTGRAGKRRYPPKKTVRENAQSYWLEMQMGWKPLLSDVDNAAKAIADYVVRQPPDVCRVKGRGGVQREDVSIIPASGPWAAGRSILSTEVSCDIEVFYTFNSRQVAAAKKFGLSTVLPTLWEVIPFSWCVDYFIGIGTYLEDIFAFQGLDFHSGRTSYKITQKLSRSQDSLGTQYDKYYDYWASRGTWLSAYKTASGYVYSSEVFGFKRSRLTAFPRARAPQVRVDFSGDRGLTKLLNLLALFGQFNPSNRSKSSTSTLRI